jgi:hypothetical protein
MKRFAVAVLSLLLLSPFTYAADKADKTASATTTVGAKDTKYLLDYMKKTRQDFLKSIKGLSEAQWKFKAAPDRWSIAETAEHITLSEDFISNNIKEKVMKTPLATDEQKAKVRGQEESIIQKITDRSHKAQAPEPLKPTNRWANAKEIEKAFTEKRDANIAFAKSTPEAELRNHIAPTPVGDFDAYEWLLFMSAHTKRHTLQIEEVKADPGYPKK